jgi:hypothetical protein
VSPMRGDAHVWTIITMSNWQLLILPFNLPAARILTIIPESNWILATAEALSPPFLGKRQRHRAERTAQGDNTRKRERGGARN